MELPPEFVAWQCIGCGRIAGPQPCIGVCQDRKVSFVYASDYAEAMSRLLDADERIALLEGLARRMALATPATTNGREATGRSRKKRRIMKKTQAPQSIDQTAAASSEGP